MTITASPRTSRVITRAWIVLCAITVLAWWLAPGHSDADLETASTPITFAVVCLGSIKSRLIIRYFMEVHRAPQWLRLSTDVWVASIWLTMLAIYLI